MPGTRSTHRSAAKCQHIRTVSTARVGAAGGNIGALGVTQIRESLALLLDPSD